MKTIKLKPTHKFVKAYYEVIKALTGVADTSVADTSVADTIVTPAFVAILKHGARKVGLKFVAQHVIHRYGKRPLRTDGALLDHFGRCHGIWIDIKDNIFPKSVADTNFADYPKDNIIFHSPHRLILWQNGQELFNEEIFYALDQFVEGLRRFFRYSPPAFEQWQQAVLDFEKPVKEYGNSLLALFENERQSNPRFIEAFEGFSKFCIEVINPNISINAIEELLIQYFLSKPIFRSVFDNTNFVSKNPIAQEAEKVFSTIPSLSSFSHNQKIDVSQIQDFYAAIETTAAAINDYSEKLDFFTAVYEKFFQGFAVKVVDKYGTVSTPQQVVNFMVNSLVDILQKEFGKSLGSKGVHILDPFVGTGSFIVRIMHEISSFQLAEKYRTELHCNEVMLLPYYIAMLNIEHTYYEIMGLSKQCRGHEFEGICLVDTFELCVAAENHQSDSITTVNTERIERQKKGLCPRHQKNFVSATPQIFVIIGNPPYNTKQINEFDNNKNRSYSTVDNWVADTYAFDSKASNKKGLSDSYVKAVRWASYMMRNSSQGIIALVGNNNFLDGIAYDGMRQHLVRDFSKIYHINLKGNTRASGERSRQEGTNIFDDMVRVGIGISFFIKNKESAAPAEIWSYSLDDYLKAPAKKDFLFKAASYSNLPMQRMIVTKNNTWLIEDEHCPEFENFIPLGSKKCKTTKTGEVKGVIFKTYGRGVATNRDAWAYNFSKAVLTENMERTIETYNEQVFKWTHQVEKPENVNNFVLSDYQKITWSEGLKLRLKRRQIASFDSSKIRQAQYRPFSRLNLFFDRVLNERVYIFPSIFPTLATESENRVICVKGIGMSQDFHVLMVSIIPDVHLTPNSQCFPFYIYKEDGSSRKENLTDWALKHYHEHYQDDNITKWDIFFYVYGLLHHPLYRKKYAENLKREFPRIPLVRNFWAFVQAGKHLAELHTNYDSQVEYPIKLVEQPDTELDWRVDKMKLSSDKRQIIYNDTLIIDEIPPECFEYQLGNRSALEWVIDQYRIKVDKRSGIVNDPNSLEDNSYIVRLIGQVITMSLKTVEIIKGLPSQLSVIS